MSFRFSEDKKQQLILVYKDKIIAHVEQIEGFEILRTSILDSSIDSLSNELQTKGINMSLEAINMGLHSTTPEKKVVTEKVIAKELNPFIYLINCIISFLVLISWIAGMVIAVGGMKWVALFIGYGWYLEIELLLKHLHVII
jgi:hypothetical protein